MRPLTKIIDDLQAQARASGRPISFEMIKCATKNDEMLVKVVSSYFNVKR